MERCEGKCRQYQSNSFENAPLFFGHSETTRGPSVTLCPTDAGCQDSLSKPSVHDIATRRKPRHQSADQVESLAEPRWRLNAISWRAPGGVDLWVLNQAGRECPSVLLVMQIDVVKDGNGGTANSLGIAAVQIYSQPIQAASFI
ncbi:hypothetical protein CA13_58620 [Planctomycetes bacterium CA13]|uniref:Uncharacterized protein n=1 Tax=Novipirellula herctigrandis TaxID=2527986 RepID=A0A5C5ZAL5_9BACT|nr:hypothetical protein CA13_58620 [Planctomycetes bacterium CA13]